MNVYTSIRSHIKLPSGCTAGYDSRAIVIAINDPVELLQTLYEIRTAIEKEIEEVAALKRAERERDEALRLLREAFGWIENLEPKPAQPFIDAVRRALSEPGKKEQP